MGWAVAFRLGGASIVSNVESHLPLLKGLGLAVDKVIHHDDVVLAVIIRSRGNVAGCDLDPRDARVVKHDAEEGQAPIARRGRDETAEYQFTAAVEVLDQGAGPAVSVLLARPAPIRLVNVGKDRAEASDYCWASPIGAGNEEQSFGDVAAHRSEQPRQAEGAEDGAVGGIVEEHGQSALWPA